MSKEFEKWLQREQAKGLIALHFSVKPSNSVTSEKLKQEFLACEKAIELGQLRNPPGPV